MCNAVENLGYTLNPDYSDCFGAAERNKNTAESIFEIQYYGLTKDDFWGEETKPLGSVPLWVLATAVG